MKDVVIGKPLEVAYVENSRPHIMLPVLQLEEVKALLEKHNLDYYVDDFSIAISGKPAYIVVSLDWDADPVHAQHILDSVP